ncbi:MAG: sulfatase-like hydrolase/transferase [Candidatus Lokiarchaeota archaeon]|nr:sulfatase-like hydrolase/transferase [Candidatus Lokiarchaeota archaeon]
MGSRKNKRIILITIDALRPDHLSTYGYSRETDPELLKFSKKGYKFLNAFTNGPETPSSFSAIFSSTLPLLNGGYSPLPNSKEILPEILQKYGFNTIGIHSNPNLTKFFNYGRGFDTFLDGMKYHIDNKETKDLDFRQILSRHINKIFNFQKITERFLFRLKGFNKIKHIIRKRIPFITDIILPITKASYNAPYLANKVISYLSREKSSLFLWVHFMDIHSPYNPPSEEVLKFRDQDFTLSQRKKLVNEIYEDTGKYNITKEIIEELKILYDAQISYLDTYLGKILQYIHKNYKDDCLVIITADHGESFYEHGLFGHQGSVYNELLKVPFFIIENSQNSSQKGSVFNFPIQLIDIAPTILDYLNIPIPDDFQGRSLLPLIRNDNGEFNNKRIIISECYQKERKMKRNHEEGYLLLAIIIEKWKYLYDEELNKEMLFNLDKDPEEKQNVIMKNEEILKTFRYIKEKHLKRVEESPEKEKISSVIKSIDFS